MTRGYLIKENEIIELEFHFSEIYISELFKSKFNIISFKSINDDTILMAFCNNKEYETLIFQDIIIKGEVLFYKEYELYDSFNNENNSNLNFYELINSLEQNNIIIKNKKILDNF